MSEQKVREIQEFVDDFNKKLKEAYERYEEKQNKIKNLKKSNTQIGSYRSNKENKFSERSKSYKTMEQNQIQKSFSNSNAIMKPQIWKPPNGYPDYFEEFKRLENKHQLNDWEKVSKHKNNF